MNKKRTETIDYIECDGCQYIIRENLHLIKLTIQLEPGTEPSDFHFHPILFKARSDCFRYWAHNPPIMKRSLEERGLTPEAIEDVMSHLLFRTEAV